MSDILRDYIVLVSKDATIPEYFGAYGGRIRKTPNIDELAKKGTIFKNHYTAAPSTAMAFAAMATGKYPYQMEYSGYYEVPEYPGKTMFDELDEMGYRCHILWSNNYVDKAEKFTKCYGKNTVHHDKLVFNQSCGFNAKYEKKNRDRDIDLTESLFSDIIKEIDSIDYKHQKTFLWIHMPHCIKGFRSYGDDIEIFDRLIGELRKRFGDESIFITADHGHMNGSKNKFGYGFDVYEKATHIPLITPRIEGKKEINFYTSNIQLKDIIIHKAITKMDYVLSDCAYYAQPSRKLAIIRDGIYYIYNKSSKKEEMYDLSIDPNQDINLVKGYIVRDSDRHCNMDIRQIVLSDNWDSYNDYLNEFREIKNKIWKNGSFIQETKQKLLAFKIKTIFFVKGLLNIRK